MEEIEKLKADLAKVQKENESLVKAKDAAEKAIEKLKAENAELKDAKKTVEVDLNNAKTLLTKTDSELFLVQAEVEKLKASTEVPAEVKPNDVATLSDGRKVKVHFGAHIPELGKAYSKADILESEDVISYLLEIGSGAVSVISADPRKS